MKGKYLLYCRTRQGQFLLFSQTLGDGIQGAVYLVIDAATRKNYALKTFFQPDAYQCGQGNEAHVLGTLAAAQSPGKPDKVRYAHCHESWYNDQAARLPKERRWYGAMVLDHLNGKTMTEVLERDGCRWYVKKVLLARCIHQTLETVKCMYALEPPIVHHDLHSNNVMFHFAPDAVGLPDAYLVDFGLSIEKKAGVALDLYQELDNYKDLLLPPGLWVFPSNEQRPGALAQAERDFFRELRERRWNASQLKFIIAVAQDLELALMLDDQVRAEVETYCREARADIANGFRGHEYASHGEAIAALPRGPWQVGWYDSQDLSSFAECPSHGRESQADMG